MKAAAPGPEGEADTVATIPVRVQGDRRVDCGIFFGPKRPVRERLNKLVVKLRRHAIRLRDVEAHRASRIEIAPDHLPQNLDRGESRDHIRTKHAEDFGLSDFPQGTNVSTHPSCPTRRRTVSIKDAA